AEMLGHTLDEIEPHVDAWAQRLHPDDKAEVLRRLQDHLDGKIARFEAEYRLRTKSGGWCWVYALGKVSQWDAAGSPTRILGANQDISDLKRRNDEFKKDSRHNIQAQKLESLGALAGGVAHDFNNLLMGILGNANLLEDCIPPHSEARDYLGDIETSARRAAELCHQLLAYSGRANLVMEPIDVNATVRETEALMGASISKKIAVNYQFLDSVPAIDADASQIRQILINLFANAAEAIEDASGVITVSTGVMECDEDFFAMAYYSDNALPGTYSYIQVQDTGFGMSPDTLSRAFEPFFSTHASKRGLGLPAVLGIVLSHEGCIDIESEPRKGTRVRVLFPVSELKPARIDPQGHISAGTRMRGTVLVVDDEVTVRNVAKNMLTLLGLRVITAIDGRDAVQRYEEIEEDIACVLLDLTMPHMNGEEAFDALYKLDPSIRVIISSGYAEEEIAHRFEGRAIAGFIKKPYEIDALRDTVHRAITR
ncbi:MAG: response regulator, partial [Verrucomicrobia bacterium]|nr:response regulator [Verrucomicrobiota bacterium]